MDVERNSMSIIPLYYIHLEWRRNQTRIAFLPNENSLRARFLKYLSIFPSSYLVGRFFDNDYVIAHEHMSVCIIMYVHI